MSKKLAIIGIDSLEPKVLLKYRDSLPNFSRLIEGSPTFTAKSVYPVDTIPAWASIFTGLSPDSHGLFYVYDVFDPNLSDLKKIDGKSLKGRTFWDIASANGLRSAIVFPILMYPAWEINGVMISKSPIEERKDWITTGRTMSASPAGTTEKYGLPPKIDDLWGGHPGENRMKEWSEAGKAILDQEKKISLSVFDNEQWDLYFTYFSILDIIQHRLWRFFDEKDPQYPGPNDYRTIIPDYYVLLDSLIGEFLDRRPDVQFIVLSDHGHGIRPVKTVNINEHLRRAGRLKVNGGRNSAMALVRKNALKVINKLNLEPFMVKLVAKNKTVVKYSKSVYSSSGLIDTRNSAAYLSNFAGIKSYPHGGIEINKSLVSGAEYDGLVSELLLMLRGLKADDGTPIVQWAEKRDDAFKGAYAGAIYPDIVFEFREDYGVGWDLRSGLAGRSYDHKIASGGHKEDAVLLMGNVAGRTVRANPGIIDIAPTVMDLLDMDVKTHSFDGISILK